MLAIRKSGLDLFPALFPTNRCASPLIPLDFFQGLARMRPDFHAFV